MTPPVRRVVERRQIELLVRDSLAHVYTPGGVDWWLAHANRSLGGAIPAELIRRGSINDARRVLRAAQHLEGGMVAS